MFDIHYKSYVNGLTIKSLVTYACTFDLFPRMTPSFSHLMLAGGTPYPTHVSKEVACTSTVSFELNAMMLAETGKREQNHSSTACGVCQCMITIPVSFNVTSRSVVRLAVVSPLSTTQVYPPPSLT